MTQRHEKKKWIRHHCHLPNPRRTRPLLHLLGSPLRLLYLLRTKLLQQNWVGQKGRWRSPKNKQGKCRHLFSQIAFRIGSTQSTVHCQLSQAPGINQGMCYGFSCNRNTAAKWRNGKKPKQAKWVWPTWKQQVIQKAIFSLGKINWYRKTAIYKCFLFY